MTSQTLVDLLGTQFELEFKPHKFQLSLATNSCLNKNNIICIRTGSGKTLVSALISRYWYEKYSQENKLDQFKVFFIVPTRNLVFQQSLAFLRAFKNQDIIEITENFNSLKIFSYFMSEKKIFFLTPQKLINFLNETQATLDQISILIFDECHHTQDSHPYNELMKIYYKNYDIMKKKPLIVGLTASLGVGKSPCDHLISLCANMDCQLISTLNKQEDIDDLNTNIPSPLNDIVVPVEPGQEIDEIRSNIESICSKLADLVRIDRFSIKLGRTEFDQFIYEREKSASVRNDQDLIVVIRYLNELNLFYQRCEDFPIEFCIDKLNSFSDNSKVAEPTKVKDSCDFLIKKFLKSLEFKNFIHPKLIILAKNILKYHSSSSRGLVLVRTRNHTKALVQYLNETRVLKHKGILCKSLVGLGCIDGISMNENQQKNVIREFLDGSFNVLVATDIAQEGLDIPTCNYVIRYEFVSNEIGTVQSRGRSRVSNGQCVLITASGSLNEKRESENRLKERMMEQAINELNRMEKRIFIEKFNSKREFILKSVNTNYLTDLPFQLKTNLICSSKIDVYCRDCSLFLFNGKNLRYREPCYYCICEDFILNLSVVDREKKMFYCKSKSCGRELGRTVELRKKSVPLFMVEIKAIKFKFPGNKMITFSKWSKLKEMVSIKNLTIY
ncbi:Interferon-induced helicase C domain-containing 1 [Brachionus plicatilis]|uniref:Interferon-induced helicase C domain-containing 1 n=1 Tax=Brachionus plicatilis TaxID=10195 RepID=A0A3M7QYK9_BRAPC|nr:Interferon-induced helicase C domain-containing 1 [Brachionus plicatilis]